MVRLNYDIIDKLNSNNQEGLLLLIDFERAFDSVEWNFLDEALKLFNFWESIRRWVKTFYKNINTAPFMQWSLLQLFFGLKRC